jgi:hypothetical protein
MTIPSLECVWFPPAWVRLVAFGVAALGCCLGVRAGQEGGDQEKTIVGATEQVTEVESELPFSARIDTGATTCSVHVEKWVIKDGSRNMEENVGKTIRFMIKNDEDVGHWLERKIARVAAIKTSEEEEVRYKVRMTLSCAGISKEVLVSLNDRSHMTYPLLVGRNFLQDDFLVDVSRE